MSEYRYLVLLIVIMAGVAFIVGATAIGIFYHTAFDEAQARLTETVQSHARLMEAMARFHQTYDADPVSVRTAVLEQIRKAHMHRRTKTSKKAVEFVLAQREGDHMVFLWWHQRTGMDELPPLPFHTQLAEPTQRALSGQSGTMVGVDYRGQTVIAAYEPVGVLDLGMVAKMDMSEVQATFWRIGWGLLVIAGIAVGGGALLFFAAFEPVVQFIRAGETRFQALFENMNSGAAVYEAVAGGTDFVFRAFNRAGERIEQINRTQLLGKRVTTVFPGVREFGLLEVLSRVWATGQPERHPICLYQDDRLQSWRENYVYPLPSGEIVALYEDVTAQRQAQETLQTSAARLRTLLDASEAAIALLSAEGVILAANGTAQRQFVAAPDLTSGIGSRVSEALPAASAKRWMTLVEQVTATAQVVHFEEHDGAQWFAYWGYPIVDANKTIAEIAVFVRDITARKTAELELRKLYRAIEQSPVSIVITDLQGNIEYVNPKFTNITGYSATEVLGKNPRLLKSGHTSSSEYRHLWETITAGHVWRGEFHNQTKSGELIWELASIAPIRDAKGMITHFVAVKEDITQQKATEAQLRQAQKMQAIGQLTGGIAHDFNNLLAIIMGNLQLLEERVAGQEQNQKLLNDALWSAQRGAELTRRLLAFARRQPLSPEVINLNGVITEMVDFLQRTLGASIQIETQLADDLWSVIADRGELERALVNLAVNSRDAMRDGGKLQIATQNVLLDHDYAQLPSDVARGEYVLIAISDTGKGMSDEILQHIFEPFFTTKGVGKGSGLGLSMVYGFIKQSGGHISAHSTVGLGTTIRLYLPKKTGMASLQHDLAPVLSRTDADFGNKLVLVVEDETRLRKMAIRLLKQLGLQALGAENAEVALHYLKTFPAIDLLFTDIELGHGMNGFELAEKAKTLRPAIPVIFTTGHARDAVYRQRHFQDVTPVLFKPYSRQALAAQLKASLTRTAH